MRKLRWPALHPFYQFDDEVEAHELDGFKSDLEIKWHTSSMTGHDKSRYIQPAIILLKRYTTRVF